LPTKIGASELAQSMTPCETRALLDRIDAIRDRVFAGVTVAFCGYALVIETIRHPAEMARMFFWPGVIIAAVVALHVAINWLVRRR
jgi:hypothetical protein